MNAPVIGRHLGLRVCPDCRATLRAAGASWTVRDLSEACGLLAEIRGGSS